MALDDAFGRAGLKEILAYTAADNARSQAVMSRLGLTRDPARDFTMDNGWRGMVWVARPARGARSGEGSAVADIWADFTTAEKRRETGTEFAMYPIGEV